MFCFRTLRWQIWDDAVEIFCPKYLSCYMWVYVKTSICSCQCQCQIKSWESEVTIRGTSAQISDTLCIQTEGWSVLLKDQNRFYKVAEFLNCTWIYSTQDRTVKIVHKQGCKIVRYFWVGNFPCELIREGHFFTDIKCSINTSFMVIHWTIFDCSKRNSVQ